MIMSHILIAEDENDVREFLVRAVRRLAPTAEVTAAANGSEALDIFQQQPCDLILTDQRMPVMRGIELLTAVRGMGSAVPVVFITHECSEPLCSVSFLVQSPIGCIRRFSCSSVAQKSIRQEDQLNREPCPQ